MRYALFSSDSGGTLCLLLLLLFFCFGKEPTYTAAVAAATSPERAFETSLSVTFGDHQSAHDSGRDALTLVITRDGFLHAFRTYSMRHLWSSSTGGPTVSGSNYKSTNSKFDNINRGDALDYSVIPTVDGTLLIQSIDGIRETSIKARTLTEQVPFISKAGLMFNGRKNTQIFEMNLLSGELNFDSVYMPPSTGTATTADDGEQSGGSYSHPAPLAPLLFARIDHALWAVDAVTGRKKFNISFSDIVPLTGEVLDDSDSEEEEEEEEGEEEEIRSTEGEKYRSDKRDSKHYYANSYSRKHGSWSSSSQSKTDDFLPMWLRPTLISTPDGDLYTEFDDHLAIEKVGEGLRDDDGTTGTAEGESPSTRMEFVARLGSPVVSAFSMRTTAPADSIEGYYDAEDSTYSSGSSNTAPSNGARLPISNAFDHRTYDLRIKHRVVTPLGGQNSDNEEAFSPYSQQQQQQQLLLNAQDRHVLDKTRLIKLQSDGYVESATLSNIIREDGDDGNVNVVDDDASNRSSGDDAERGVKGGGTLVPMIDPLHIIAASDVPSADTPAFVGGDGNLPGLLSSDSFSLADKIAGIVVVRSGVEDDVSSVAFNSERDNSRDDDDDEESSPPVGSGSGSKRIGVSTTGHHPTDERDLYAVVLTDSISKGTLKESVAAATSAAVAGTASISEDATRAISNSITNNSINGLAHESVLTAPIVYQRSNKTGAVRGGGGNEFEGGEKTVRTVHIRSPNRFEYLLPGKKGNVHLFYVNSAHSIAAEGHKKSSAQRHKCQDGHLIPEPHSARWLVAVTARRTSTTLQRRLYQRSIYGHGNNKYNHNHSFMRDIVDDAAAATVPRIDLLLSHTRSHSPLPVRASSSSNSNSHRSRTTRLTHSRRKVGSFSAAIATLIGTTTKEAITALHPALLSSGSLFNLRMKIFTSSSTSISVEHYPESSNIWLLSNRYGYLAHKPPQQNSIEQQGDNACLDDLAAENQVLQIYFSKSEEWNSDTRETIDDDGGNGSAAALVVAKRKRDFLSDWEEEEEEDSSTAEVATQISPGSTSRGVHILLKESVPFISPSSLFIKRAMGEDGGERETHDAVTSNKILSLGDIFRKKVAYESLVAKLAKRELEQQKRRPTRKQQLDDSLVWSSQQRLFDGTSSAAELKESRGHVDNSNSQHENFTNELPEGTSWLTSAVSYMKLVLLLSGTAVVILLISVTVSVVLQRFSANDKLPTVQLPDATLMQQISDRLARLLMFDPHSAKRRSMTERENHSISDEGTGTGTVDDTLSSHQNPVNGAYERVGTSMLVFRGDRAVLGRGSHGTVVLRGRCHGRAVAVKKMLAHSMRAAEREISLLLRSDDHPNVVRYFGKEQKNDFIYLALQLCDMSLRDFIMRLKPLHVQYDKSIYVSGSSSSSRGSSSGQRKTDGHMKSEGVGRRAAYHHPLLLSDGVKRSLKQMADGVAHLHSLHILHRDIKPHNTLLMRVGVGIGHEDSNSKKKSSTDNSKKNTSHMAGVAGIAPAAMSSSGSGGSDVVVLLRDDVTGEYDSRQTLTINSLSSLKDYVLKISDMGLSKYLEMDQNNGNDSTSSTSVRDLMGGGVGATHPTADAAAGDAAASLHGYSMVGTIGWQAPELLALRYAASERVPISSDSRTCTTSRSSSTTSVDKKSLREEEEEADSSNGHSSSSSSVTGRSNAANSINNNKEYNKSPSPKSIGAMSSSTVRSLSKSISIGPASDIFSLGCVLYYCLTCGEHPFGQWFERESNIHLNRVDFTHLIDIHGNNCGDAIELLSEMLHPDPSMRPTGDEVCAHPFFWSSSQRLEFLVQLSDLIEHESGSSEVLLQLESLCLVGWDRRLDNSLIDEMTAATNSGSNAQLTTSNASSRKFRRYDYNSTRDLLRLVRNKRNHYAELGPRAKQVVGALPDEFVAYFEYLFPELLLHCVYVVRCSNHLMQEPSLIPWTRGLRSKGNKQSRSSRPSMGNNSGTLDTPNLSTVDTKEENRILPSPTITTITAPVTTSVQAANTQPSSHMIIAEEASFLLSKEVNTIVWQRSLQAAALSCSGWWRDTTSWQRGVSGGSSIAAATAANVPGVDNGKQGAKRSQLPVHIRKASADGRYRSSLCEHWEKWSVGMLVDNSNISDGKIAGGSMDSTFPRCRDATSIPVPYPPLQACPMRKKGKCNFAHGPLELRLVTPIPTGVPEGSTGIAKVYTLGTHWSDGRLVWLPDDILGGARRKSLQQTNGTVGGPASFTVSGTVEVAIVGKMNIKLSCEATKASAAAAGTEQQNGLLPLCQSNMVSSATTSHPKTLLSMTCALATPFIPSSSKPVYVASTMHPPQPITNSKSNKGTGKQEMPETMPASKACTPKQGRKEALKPKLDLPPVAPQLFVPHEYGRNTAPSAPGLQINPNAMKASPQIPTNRG